jgi:hypothetical protein
LTILGQTVAYSTQRVGFRIGLFLIALHRYSLARDVLRKTYASLGSTTA